MSEKSKETKQEMGIEESFEYLDDVLNKMEDEDLPLEDAFALYEKGMQVLKQTAKKIDAVEKKVKLVNARGETEDFE